MEQETLVTIPSKAAVWVQLVLKTAGSMNQAVQLLDELPCEYFFVENAVTGAPESLINWTSRQFKNSLFVNASAESLRPYVRSHNDCFRFRGMRGRKVVEYPDAQVDQFLLFVHTVERNLLFCKELPTNVAEPVTLHSGPLSGVKGLLSVSKNYVYRLFVDLLGAIYVNISISKSELSPVYEIQPIVLDCSEGDKDRGSGLYSRKEKELYDTLSGMGSTAYIPTRMVREADGRMNDCLVMRGYVFIKTSRRQLERMRADNPLMGMHPLMDRSRIPHQPMSVPDKEMEDFIYVNDTYGSQLDVTEGEVQGGERVELLIKGFEGIQGVLVKRGNLVQVAIGVMGHAVYFLDVNKTQYKVV